MGETDLVSLAKQGDAGAAAEIIASHLPYWMGAARQIIAADSRSLRAGGPLEEPAELVQEAMMRLLEQWRQGQGPESNPRSYVTSIMRHSYSNKLRSPRMQERPFAELDRELSFTVTDNVQHADLSREMDIVRRALHRLTLDHRTVLLAVTVEGKKPGELTAQLGRPAPAVSNLLARAKHALFRQVLIEHLGAGGSECRENAEQLPKRVHEDPSLHAHTDQGIEHVRECQHCQGNWRRFATILSAFGLLPLLLVAQLTAGSAPAEASEGDTPPDEPTEDVTPEQSSSGGSGSSSPGSQGFTAPTAPPSAAVFSAATSAPAAASAAAATTGGTGAAAVTTVPPAAAVAASPDGNTALVGGPNAASRIARALSSKATLGIGVVCLAASMLAMGGHAAFGTREGEEIIYTGDVAEHNPYGASLDVALHTDDEGALQAISADFAVREVTNWTMHQVTLVLSPGTDFRSASNGLACATSGTLTVCEPTAESDLGGTFLFEVENAQPGGTFSLELTTEVDGDAGSGRATGHW